MQKEFCNNDNASHSVRSLRVFGTICCPIYITLHLLVSDHYQ